jgi:formylglycine-generating enzyme required for sulfatase activity
MKYTVYFIAMLLLLLGCKEDNPNTKPVRGSQEQNAQQDKNNIADVNGHQEAPMDDPARGKSFTNSIGMNLVYIPPGEFMMGSRDTVEEVVRKGGGKSKNAYLTDEHPQHRVKITNGFFMGSTEVSQAQYVAIMVTNPSAFKGENNPVETVSWNKAVEFCKKLSEREGKTYRLPTEAEWEYACRAGTTTPFHTGETIHTSQANYEGNYVYGSGTKGVNRERTISVGSFPPNAFGLYDMHGNVWEWCQDWYGKDYYSTSPTTDPQGPSTGVYPVLRGGSCSTLPRHCRSAIRFRNSPFARIRTFGFRILLDLN